MARYVGFNSQITLSTNVVEQAFIERLADLGFMVYLVDGMVRTHTMGYCDATILHTIVTLDGFFAVVGVDNTHQHFLALADNTARLSMIDGLAAAVVVVDVY